MFYYCEKCGWFIISRCFSFVAEPLVNGKRKRYHMCCYRKINSNK